MRLGVKLQQGKIEDLDIQKKPTHVYGVCLLLSFIYTDWSPKVFVSLSPFLLHPAYLPKPRLARAASFCCFTRDSSVNVFRQS